jgi:hypothetical protein
MNERGTVVHAGSRDLKQRLREWLAREVESKLTVHKYATNNGEQKKKIKGNSP